MNIPPVWVSYNVIKLVVDKEKSLRPHIPNIWPEDTESPALQKEPPVVHGACQI